MHASKDAMSEIVSQALYGTPIKIIERDNQWAKIETPDAYQGWCQASNLISTPAPYPNTPTSARVRSYWAHIHPVPDTTPRPPILTIPYGVEIEVISSPDELNQRWIQVRLLNGKIYWAQSEDFALNPHPLCLDEMVDQARKFLGIPYLWGGKSTFGFDCSGLIQTLFAEMGIRLPRDAVQQAKADNALPIAIDQIQKGDLVFFGPSSARITHVGLYIGHGKFIHSVTTNLRGPRAIQVGSLDNPEWGGKLICARRVAQQ